MLTSPSLSFQRAPALPSPQVSEEPVLPTPSFALPSRTDPPASLRSRGREARGCLRKGSSGFSSGWPEPGLWTRFSKRYKEKGLASAGPVAQGNGARGTNFSGLGRAHFIPLSSARRGVTGGAQPSAGRQPPTCLLHSDTMRGDENPLECRTPGNSGLSRQTKPGGPRSGPRRRGPRREIAAMRSRSIAIWARYGLAIYSPGPALPLSSLGGKTGRL